ncbi:hypothetical protein AB3S75_039658 [Citrus x aurantiifolia]
MKCIQWQRILPFRKSDGDYLLSPKSDEAGPLYRTPSKFKPYTDWEPKQSSPFHFSNTQSRKASSVYPQDLTLCQLFL